jgi:ATP synthase protein I
MQSVDTLVLRGAGVPTLVVGALATAVSWAVAGVPGLIGGVLGTVIVVAFFSVGQFVLGRVLRDNPQMAMTVAMTLYLVKIGVLFGFIVLFAGTTAFDTKAFGLTIVACTLTWTVAEVWVFARTKVLYVEPESSSGTTASKDRA